MKDTVCTEEGATKFLRIPGIFKQTKEQYIHADGLQKHFLI